MGKRGAHLRHSWVRLTSLFIHSSKKLLENLFINIIFYIKKSSLLKKIGRKILVRHPILTLKYAQIITSMHAERKQLAIKYSHALNQMAATHNNTLKKIIATYNTDLKQLPPSAYNIVLKQMIASHNIVLEQMMAMHKTALSLQLTLQQLTPRAEAIYYLFDRAPQKDD